ncbi:type II toxin-antitoxin system RelE/ParE family toxin [Parabacteroides acidifaciens]|uniref:Type II toxin-antitoxin system RelE/ParE family toxin n=1 Tax=Parabacteroides acidifaciens TaxID=2290935 RepID=A0A3D8HE01_9BACT|nr:type II toxin-antitoxin system RelE/ParE family toxin [Parabacteroides acidifaciens]MBC8602352.1 type II toxin-antitoxin system RelE/ParE family toxin [Parabacteroides acidifaciens]RDU48970.1 type II toxin-antitoxin system RelE/ParE family toxin [Parabacteroides acidifaciens]
METLTVRWNNDASDKFIELAQWFETHMGEKAASKFIEGIMHSIELLTTNPQLGFVEPELSGRSKQYRAIIEHKRYKIIYFVENDAIHIADIWNCLQDNSNSKIK